MNAIPVRDLGIFILAAGQSSRFGGCKLLAEVDGKPLLQHVIDQVSPLAPDDTYVLSGGWHSLMDLAFKEGTLSGAKLCYIPDWQQGMGSVIAQAAVNLAPMYQRILIALGDQVAIFESDFRQLALVSLNTDKIVCADYGDRLGAPAIFPRQFYVALSGLSGDNGARVLLNNEPEVMAVSLAKANIDIDTPGELEKWREDITPTTDK